MVTITIATTITTVITTITTTINQTTRNHKEQLNRLVVQAQAIQLQVVMFTLQPSSNGVSLSNARSASGNLYTSGQCTYYVFDRVGGKIGSTWGNANNWANAAARSGYTVNNSPAKGAILQTSQGAYGHVAYVEVNSNGSIRVSEMNYGHGAGVVTSRTISASQAASYNYIH